MRLARHTDPCDLWQFLPKVATERFFFFSLVRCLLTDLACFAALRSEHVTLPQAFNMVARAKGDERLTVPPLSDIMSVSLALRWLLQACDQCMVSLLEDLGKGALCFALIARVS